MKMRRKCLSLFLSAALLVTGLGMTAYAAEGNGSSASTVTIYTTNDIHGVVAGSDTAIGLVQAAGIAASTPNSLLVDAGDATQGASFATIKQGADVIRVMNAAGYDVMTAGNHEFDYGSERLLANAELAEFPILGANVQKDGKAMLEASTVVEVAGHKIGFIGLTTRATATSTNPAQLTGVSFADEVETAKKQIAELKDQTDAIVLVCHMGDNGAAVGCTSLQLLTALSSAERKEVAAVIDGHSHTIEQTPYSAGDVTIPVVQTGTGFTNLGVITLNFDGNGHVTASESVMDRAAAMAYPLNDVGKAAADKTAAVLAQVQSEQEAVLGQVIGGSATPLWGGYVYYDYAEPRIVETGYGDFVTDVFLASAKEFAKQHDMRQPVIAVENGGGISATLPVGVITRGDILNAFNHGNMVEVMEITPEQLYTALEIGLTMTGQDETGLLLRTRVSGSFLQVAGFSYTYDPAGPSGAKVTSVVLDDGKELSRTDKITKLLVATNNYVTTFKGIADGRKVGELGGEDALVSDYIQNMNTDDNKPFVYPTTANRIQIANDKSPDTYQVSIPVEDSQDKSASLAGQTVYLRIDDGKEKAYTISRDNMLHMTLSKGPHTLYLRETADNIPVYVNNYSGSGTVTTRDGYYRLAFKVDRALVGKDMSGSNGTWSRDPGGWRFKFDNGHHPAGEWAYLKWRGTYCWYYFDETGYMATGWLDDNGHRYYFHPLHDGTCGRMYTGRQLIDGVWYEFSTDEDGPLGALITE